MWVVEIEKQTMKTPPKKVGEKVFATKIEAIKFYRKNKRNGFPWTIYCYPRERNGLTLDQENRKAQNEALAQFKKQHGI